MSTFTVIITNSPYNSQNPYNALRFALGAIAEEHNVRIFLIGDGVYVAQKNQKSQFYQIEKMVRECMEFGCEIKACGVCCDERGVTQDIIIDGIEIASITDLVVWVDESDNVLNF